MILEAGRRNDRGLVHLINALAHDFMLDGWLHLRSETFDRQMVDPSGLQEGANQRHPSFLLNSFQ